MRSKLHLSDEELMNKSWISLCLEMNDFPYYSYNSKQVIKVKTKKQADEILGKYIKS